MNKKLFWFLMVVLVFGLFLRVYGLDSQLLIGEENINAVASLKFTKSFLRDGFTYSPENPPFGRMILSVPSLFIDADYNDIPLIKPMTNIYNNFAYDAMDKNKFAMRLLSALAGIFSIFFIYLITKLLFDEKAAIWSAVLSAIAFDLIIYSRMMYMNSFIVFFSLGVLYFFIKYLKSKLKTRYLYLGLVYLFLFFAVGSHHVQPWFLIPVLIASQFLFNRKLREDILVSIGYLLTFGLMWFLYSSLSYLYVTNAIAKTYEGASGSFMNMIFGYISNITFPTIIISFLLRNNYVLCLVSLICAFVFFKLLFRKKLFDKVKKMVVSKNLRLILVMLFVVSFLGLGITPLGNIIRHILFLFIPLYIFSGVVIEKIVKKKLVLYLIIFLILISVVQGVYNFPSSTIMYSNFGVSSYKAENYEEKLNEEIINYLDKLGNPVIMTNHLNTLIFYKGVKTTLPLQTVEECVPDFFSRLKYNNILILYNGPTDEDEMIKVSRSERNNNPYFCELLEQIKFKIVKKFDENLILYKIA